MHVTHWSETDPGPLTQQTKNHRVQQLIIELRTEQAAADRLAVAAPNIAPRWRTALSRNITTHLDYLTTRLQVEQARPTEENQ